MSTPVNLRLAVITLLVALCCGLLLLACRGPQLARNAESSEAEIATSFVPAFSTREPERYQAVRAVTLVGSSTSDATQTTTVLIARDGLKRRQEYEVSGRKLVYLEIPAGRFILAPAETLYADLKAGPVALPGPDPGAPVPAISSFTQSRTETRYQRLGREILGNRPTFKYRVFAGERSENSMPSETLIWIDEVLGMPIRSEMRRGDDNTVELVIELRDISFEIDERLFELPENYKKVETEVILGQLRPRAN